MQGNRRVSSKTFGSLSPLIPFGDGHTLPPSLPLWGTPSESEAKITLYFLRKSLPQRGTTKGDRKPYLRFKVRRTLPSVFGLR